LNRTITAAKAKIGQAAACLNIGSQFGINRLHPGGMSIAKEQNR
jgi:hypothetical protein